MHWTERDRAVVRIGEELRNRGWTLFGYHEDRSDMQTDYYAPASWDGVATHPELSGTVVCVDVSEHTVSFQSGDNGWPEFKAVQHGKTWHVERDHETIYAGVGLAGCSWSSERWHDKVRQVCDHIERVAYGPAQTASESSTVAATGDYTITVEHDKDWTWLFFNVKPLVEVRDRLKGMGARWGRKRQGWYFRRNVPDAELVWLTGDGPYQAQPKKETKPDRPEPKFDVGDFVLFEWETESPERHEIIDREYREFEGNWHYKADWKWWGENGLIMAEAETEPPEPVQVSEKLPDGWKIEDIEFLLKKVKDGRHRILVADSKLGIPTIHDFAGTRHCGMGVMKATLDGCTITFDAGASMDRTPSGQGFTGIQVTKGEYDYPFDEVRAKLEAIVETVAEEGPETAAEVKLKQCLDDRHEIWIGETWEDAIRQSVTTPDCGIEETETGYCLFGWGNGYEQKYTRPIPPVLNTYVEQLLQDQKEAKEAQDMRDLLHKGEPPQVLTQSNAQTLTTDRGAVIVPDDKNDAEEEDGIPDFIEVDLGRKYGWATAAVERLRGKWLYYHLTQKHCHKPDTRGGKVQIIGRDILWRSTAAPASQGGAQ